MAKSTFLAYDYFHDSSSSRERLSEIFHDNVRYWVLRGFISFYFNGLAAGVGLIPKLKSIHANNYYEAGWPH